jgi:CubicO group peptidase (beta-lactamase class C family)
LDRAPLQLVAPSPAFDGQEERFARAFAVIRQAIEQHAFPGAALAVTHHGALIACRGFGNFTYDPGSPQVQADTIFDLASVTKVITTTTMAMLLHERGQLALQTPIAAIVPEFVSLAPVHQRERRQAVTVRMLLAHTSGLPAYEKLFEFAETRVELERAALTTRLVADPGMRAEYSDIGFIVLGSILARIAEVSLDAFAQDAILSPLGMARSLFNPPKEWRTSIPPTEEDRTFRKRTIQGEVNDENAYVMGGVGGHAGLFASATDVARFAECMLHGGAPILKSGTAELFTRREETPAGTSRALGWDTPSYPSSSGSRFTPSSFGHLGFTGTSLWIDPKRRLSVTLLTNRTWPNRASQAIRTVRPQVHDAIVDALGDNGIHSA